MNNLAPVTQTFVDAINRNNGMDTPRKPKKRVITKPALIDSNSSEKLTKATEILLSFIGPDESYDIWMMVIMAVNHAFNGDEVGFSLVDSWAAQGEKYDGSDALKYKYESCNSYAGDGYTLGSLLHHAKELGHDTTEVQRILNSSFEVLSTKTQVVECDSPIDEVANDPCPPSPTKPISKNPLLKFSLLGKSEDYKKQFSRDIPVFTDIALQGQTTLIFARYNSGKTLIVISMLVEAIQQGRINPSNVIYVNADDNGSGLLEKMKLADEFGFHMLAPNFEGFNHNELLEILIQMAKDGSANNVIVILDTLKKFTDLMDKRKASHFGTVARQFVLRGGTIIGLAHVNKRKDNNGDSIFAGTSDSVDDADCAYIVDIVKEDTERRTIRFKNEKGRGYVAQEVYFSYSLDRNQSYKQLLDSVQIVDPTSIQTPAQMQEQAKQKAESDCISSITEQIKLANNQKMQLVDTVRLHIQKSRSYVQDILDKYTGVRWGFEVKERGAKVYHLTEHPDDTSEPRNLGN
tara:strand:- start:1541 stop:3097 length:1557 start_codon:yes stop_codon:yes gene_type:complete